MSNRHHYAVIMAGGRGERFWPLSREHRPKQLLPLLGGSSLIEATVARLRGVVPAGNIWIITNRRQAPAIKKLLHSIPAGQIIAEPEGRDSAGAVLLGAGFIGNRDRGATIAFLPADQHIQDVPRYRRALRLAFVQAARRKTVVTLGQKPVCAHTGYGYIRSGRALASSGGLRLLAVNSFHEKPAPARAKRMLKAGNFYWNLGIFVWSLLALEKGFRKSPAHAAAWPKVTNNPRSFLAREFRKLPKISIDYAVIEKMRDILVVAGAFGWDDIGSWNALFQHLRLDNRRNLVRGKADLLDTEDCLVFSDGTRIGVVGARNLIVVKTKDALLICDRTRDQDIKKLVASLPKELR